MIELVFLKKDEICPLMSKMRSWLSTTELALVEAGSVAKVQEERLLSYGSLRLLLSSRLHKRPSELFIERLPGQKPRYLPQGDPGIYFSVSHSSDWMLFGFSYQFDLGVDLERRRPLDDMPMMAKSHFSPTERKSISEKKDQHERLCAFYRTWCRKEAYLKQKGTGIVEDLFKVETSWPVFQGCQIRDIEGPAGYAAALCFPDEPPSLRGRGVKVDIFVPHDDRSDHLESCLYGHLSRGRVLRVD